MKMVVNDRDLRSPIGEVPPGGRPRRMRAPRLLPIVVPEVDMTDEHARRLAELKRQVASGEYRPDPDAVARELLDRGFPFED